MNNIDYESLKPIRINPGAEVEGDDFFGRENELNYLFDNIKNPRSSFIIPGPRRWGKSSFIKEFMRRNENNYGFCYMHLQRTQSIHDFYDYFLDIISLKRPNALILKSRRKISNLINSITSILKKAGIEGLNIELGEIRKKKPEELLRLIGDIVKIFPKKKIILVLDEISDFLNDLNDQAVYFLKWLRVLRQASNIQMIMTGSINITSIVKVLKVEDLIGDMQILPLKPIEVIESIIFFKSLLKSRKIQISGEALDFCTSKVRDGIHYFIQVFADEIRKKFNKNAKISNENEIKDLYKDLLDSNLPALSYYHTRIDEYFKGDESIVKKILANLSSGQMDFDNIFAITGKAVNDNKEHLYNLLQRLCDEGYLKKREKKFSFLSVFLSDYWEKHFYFER